MKSNVSKELGLDETASGTEDVLVGRRLNQAVRKFLLATNCNVNKATDTIDTAGQDQDLAATAMKVLDIQITGSDSTVVVPERTTRLDILRMARASSTATGTTRFWAHEGSLWSFYPALAAGDVVTLYYVPKPTEMSSAAHDPSTETYGAIPVEYHDALEYYALWRLASYDNAQQRNEYLAFWQREILDCRKALRVKGGRRMGRAVLGSPRYVSSDPART